MPKSEETVNDKSQKRHLKRVAGYGSSPAGAVYGLGLIGAVIYYIQHATSFWEGLLGILKALVWPAILVYKALEMLKL